MIAILVTCYNRPCKLALVLERVSSVRDVDIYIACDGPKGAHDLDAVLRCRTLARAAVVGPSRLLVRTTNKGCREAMEEAITWFFSKVPEGIVLEDDVLLDLSFIEAARHLLPAYRNRKDIFQINSYVPNRQNIDSPFFLGSFVSSWGWASWADRWSKYNPMIRVNKESLQATELSVGRGILFWHFVLIFIATRQNKNSSWAYRWLYTIWRHKGGALTPRVPLCEVIGFDASATHGSKQARLRQPAGVLLESDMRDVERCTPRSRARDIAAYSYIVRPGLCLLAKGLVTVLIPAPVYRRLRRIVR